jgi:hypothetical protein
VWLGGKPFIEEFTKSKKEFLGNDEFNFPRQKESFSIQTNKVEGKWLAEILQNISVSN